MSGRRSGIDAAIESPASGIDVAIGPIAERQVRGEKNSIESPSSGGGGNTIARRRPATQLCVAGHSGLPSHEKQLTLFTAPLIPMTNRHVEWAQSSPPEKQLSKSCS